MPMVIPETDECSICLQEYELGEQEREMPYKHMFYLGYIEKLLGIHGSCPFCRFMVPVKEGEEEDRQIAEGKKEQELMGRMG